MKNLFEKIPYIILPSVVIISLLISYTFILPADTDLISYQGDYLLGRIVIAAFLGCFIVDVSRIIRHKLNWKVFIITTVFILMICISLYMKLFLNQGCFVDC